MKIIYVPNQPHCYAFGGFEIQMLTAFDAAKQAGCDVILFNPWERNLDFDLVHIWGLEITQSHNINYAHAAGKKIVVTVLMPDLSSLYKRFRFFVSGLIYKVRIQKELSRKVDAIITVSEVQREAIRKFYGFPAEKIHIIPNVISSVYLDAIPADNPFGINDYVLCTGNICSRKNQLNLVKACNDLNLTVLLMGNPMLGEESYAASVEVELARNPQSKWIRNIPANSEMLKAGYQHCRLFALLSQVENQPISILEAQAMKCRILLANKPYTKQELFKHLPTVNPDDVNDIKRGIETACQLPVPYNPGIDACSLANVGQLHRSVYQTYLS